MPFLADPKDAILNPPQAAIAHALDALFVGDTFSFLLSKDNFDAFIIDTTPVPRVQYVNFAL